MLMELWFQVQGLLKLGQCRDDKMRRLTLKIDAADITFALQVLIIRCPSIFVPLVIFLFLISLFQQGVRFFRNCLQ